MISQYGAVSTQPGSFFNIKTIFSGISIWSPMVKIRWSHNHVIFVIEIITSGKMVFILKQDPGFLYENVSIQGGEQNGIVQSF